MSHLDVPERHKLADVFWTRPAPDRSGVDALSKGVIYQLPLQTTTQRARGAAVWPQEFADDSELPEGPRDRAARLTARPKSRESPNQRDIAESADADVFSTAERAARRRSRRISSRVHSATARRRHRVSLARGAHPDIVSPFGPVPELDASSRQCAGLRERDSSSAPPARAALRQFRVGTWPD